MMQQAQHDNIRSESAGGHTYRNQVSIWLR